MVEVLAKTNVFAERHCVLLFIENPAIGFGKTVTSVEVESIHPAIVVAISLTL